MSRQINASDVTEAITQRLIEEGASQVKEDSVLVQKILEKAQRFFEIAEFKYYALADGIYWILAGVRAGLLLLVKKGTESPQMLLPFGL